MAAMLKPSAEYNRRAAIIEGLRAGCSAMEIIRFFGYSKLTVYDVVTCCDVVTVYDMYGFRTVQRRFQYASEKVIRKNTRTPAVGVVERT